MDILRRIRPNSALRRVRDAANSKACFSTTPVAAARKGRVFIDRRISMIRSHLWHPLTPRPLRLSRNRTLRHWTIDQAWKVFTAKRAQERELELEKQWVAMRDACEKLRALGDDGVVGGKETGRLFRQSIEKAGVWQGVPIEYARLLTDWPSRDGWNHGWKKKNASS